MEQEIDTIIPRLDEGLRIGPFNKDEFLLEHERLNYQVNVNQKVMSIINLVDGERSISQITDDYLMIHHEHVSSEVVHQILFNQLAIYGFIKQDGRVVEQRGKASYLRLSMELVSAKITNAIVKHLTFLFQPLLFSLLVFTLPAFLLFVFFRFKMEIVAGFESFISPRIFLFFILFGFWTFIHEFGHATACKKFGVSPGGIGFGFYLFTPVLYSDVSRAWRLPVQQRIIVNIGGIYFEMIGASLLLVIFFMTQDPLFLAVPCLIFIDSLYNLNPLVKYDGYWILSDLINIPNLHKRARLLVVEVYKSRGFQMVKGVKQFFFISLWPVKCFVDGCFCVSGVVFGCRLCHLFSATAFTLVNHPGSVVVDAAFFAGWIIPLIFYYLLFRYLLKIVRAGWNFKRNGKWSLWLRSRKSKW
jgi:putative peptide zinc metalloprotease protein